MSDVWKAGPEVFTTVKNLIANNQALTPLAGCDDEILVVFKEKATTSGNVVISGKTAKASPLMGLVGETKYKFVITLAADEWQSMTDSQREALLFHHLCACGVEENPDTGDSRYFTRVPDVSFFRPEVETYGFWRTSGSTPLPDFIAQLFGDTPSVPPSVKPQSRKGKGAKGQQPGSP